MRRMRSTCRRTGFGRALYSTFLPIIMILQPIIGLGSRLKGILNAPNAFDMPPNGVRQGFVFHIPSNHHDPPAHHRLGITIERDLNAPNAFDMPPNGVRQGFVFHIHSNHHDPQPIIGLGSRLKVILNAPNAFDMPPNGVRQGFVFNISSNHDTPAHHRLGIMIETNFECAECVRHAAEWGSAGLRIPASFQL